MAAHEGGYNSGMSTEKTYKHLEHRPCSFYRQLFVKGRRIRAEILYGLTIPGDDGEVYTPEEVAEDFGLPLEMVQEAIAYCASNPPEIALDHARRAAHGSQRHEPPRLQVQPQGPLQDTDSRGVGAPDR